MTSTLPKPLIQKPYSMLHLRENGKKNLCKVIPNPRKKKTLYAADFQVITSFTKTLIFVIALHFTFGKQMIFFNDFV